VILSPVYFELNSKMVVDSFHSNKVVDLIEFGDIMCKYLRIFSFPKLF